MKLRFMDARAMGAQFAQPWAITEETMRALIDTVVGNTELTIEARGDEDDEEPDYLSNWEMQDNGIARVPVNGPLVAHHSFWVMLFGGSSYESLIYSLKQALARRPRAIVLDVDSPGGQVAGLDDVIALLRGIDIPVIAHVRGQAASAAYEIVSVADHIVAPPSAVVGCLGTVVTMRDYTQMWANEGIKVHELVSSQTPYKRPDLDTKDGRDSVLKVLYDLTEAMFETIAKGRGVDRDTVANDFGKGAVLAGASALEARMIDQVGSYADAEATALERAAARPFSFWPTASNSINAAGEADHHKEGSMELQQLIAALAAHGHQALANDEIAQLKACAAKAPKEGQLVVEQSKYEELKADAAQLPGLKEKVEAQATQLQAMEKAEAQRKQEAEQARLDTLIEAALKDHKIVAADAGAWRDDATALGVDAVERMLSRIPVGAVVPKGPQGRASDPADEDGGTDIRGQAKALVASGKAKTMAEAYTQLDAA